MTTPQTTLPRAAGQAAQTPTPDHPLYKLNYIAGKLGLIPAFGDSIGRDVNKAELSLCKKYAIQAHIAFEHQSWLVEELVAALEEVTAQHDAMLATLPNGFGWGRLVTDKARAALQSAKEGQA